MFGFLEKRVKSKNLSHSLNAHIFYTLLSTCIQFTLSKYFLEMVFSKYNGSATILCE